MNAQVEILINSIENNFKTIFKEDIIQLRKIEITKDIKDCTLIDLQKFSKDEIEYIIEYALLGMDYYIKNFVKVDSIKYGFPIASYNSILAYMENKSNSILLYTKNIPRFNESFKTILINKGYL